MKMNKIESRASILDVLVTIIVLLILYLIPTAFIKEHRAGIAKGDELIIFKNAEEIKRMDLRTETTVNIEGMELEVKDGSVKVLRSDCPRAMCKHFGSINAPGQVIICAPKKILIEISGKSEEPEYNVMSY